LLANVQNYHIKVHEHELDMIIFMNEQNEYRNLKMGWWALACNTHTHTHTLESCANKVNLKQLHKSTCTELGLHAN